MKLPITTKNDMFGLYLYPFAKKIMEKQQDVIWFAQEIKVEKDIQDFKTKMDEYQYRLVTSTLQLFVETEQRVGDIWDTLAKLFPHSEIEGACTQIAAMEKSVHAFFYQKINDVLNLEPEEIKEAQQTIHALKSKLEFLNKSIRNIDNNIPLGLVTVALIEQVFLFSNFAMLKSFKANGYNLMVNTLTGVDFVVQDETLHGLFASGLYRVYMEELKTNYPEEYEVIYKQLNNDIKELVINVVNHEYAVVDYTFKGTKKINDITADEFKAFIRSRANKVLEDIGEDLLFTDTNNSIDSWFYNSANSLKLHDFFSTNTSQYRRNWKTEGFSLLPFIKDKK